MKKIPFELVQIEADKILMKILKATTEDEAWDIFHTFEEYLKSCGYSENEYDNLLLGQIDKNWDLNPKDIEIKTNLN